MGICACVPVCACAVDHPSNCGSRLPPFLGASCSWCAGNSSNLSSKSVVSPRSLTQDFRRRLPERVALEAEGFTLWMGRAPKGGFLFKMSEIGRDTESSHTHSEPQERDKTRTATVEFRSWGDPQIFLPFPWASHRPLNGEGELSVCERLAEGSGQGKCPVPAAHVALYLQRPGLQEEEDADTGGQAKSTAPT